MQAKQLLELLVSSQVMAAEGENGKMLLVVTLGDGSEIAVGVSDIGHVEQVLYLRDIGKQREIGEELDGACIGWLAG